MGRRYRRPYSGASSTRRRHRTPQSKRKSDKMTKSLAIKLTLCLLLFLAAVIVKLLWPHAVTSAAAALDADVDYKAALTTLGEGMNGNKKLTDAISEAFAYAFTEKSGDTQTAVPAEDGRGAAATDDGKAVTEASPSAVGADSSRAASDSTSATEALKTASVDACVQTAPGNVKATFLSAQKRYSDLAVPADVTYDMPAINIKYTLPVKGTVSSPFGYRVHPGDGNIKFHYGTDIAADEGTPIYAFADGTVKAIGKSDTLGNYVILSHSGVITEYGHCKDIFVKSGQTVKLGDKIASMGKTGNATDNCLHFEMKIDGKNVNPEYYISWT